MKKGQIWVETVIYTLIGLALIGLVLTIVTPKINEFKDRSVIEQTIDAMRILDNRIAEVVQQGPGNVRTVEFGLKRGDLYLDFTSDQIYYELEDSRIIYSEPGEEISIGRIKVLTTEGTINHKVRLTLDYDSDLVFEDKGTPNKKFTAASVPYTFSINNLGFSDDGVVREVLEIKELARK